MDLIHKRAQVKGARPIQVKAALETGLVESNLRNLSGGDADSAGWRQERASLYKNPTNLRASIDRFFDETKPLVGKYGKAGDLAAAVQRPAAQYRGRYQDVSSRAQALLSSGGPSAVPGRRTTTTTSGPSEIEQRSSVLGNYLATRGQPGALLGLGVGLGNIQAPTTTTRTTSAPSSATPASKGGGKLLELFWQGPGGINAKDGKAAPQGFVTGHKDHVHVAAGPKTVVQLGQLAQQMGLHVGENPHFGGVAPVHVQNSYHYKGEAIDVSGSPAKMRAYAHRVASIYGIR